jgi:hypothetical protein
MATPPLSPVTTSAARRSTSCLEVPGPSPPGVSSRLRREVAAATPTPKAAPHRKWVETLIGFDSSDCLESMASAGQLPLLVSPTISNVKLYHVLIDGGTSLNLISLAAFKKL